MATSGDDLSSSHSVCRMSMTFPTIASETTRCEPLHFQPKLHSIVLRACCLLFLHSMGLIWVFLHLDIVARLPELPTELPG